MHISHQFCVNCGTQSWFILILWDGGAQENNAVVQTKYKVAAQLNDLARLSLLNLGFVSA